MIENERSNRGERVLDVARKMLTAARTAPKGRGVDLLECCVLTGDDIKALSERMLQLHADTGKAVYGRDGENILKAEAVVVIATCQRPLGLNCGHCGFPGCAEKPKEIPCVFNSVDVGIAIGSAVAMAADMRVDCRVMYSAGMAAQRMQLLGEEARMYFCIPLSCSSKNPFFDR